MVLEMQMTTLSFYVDAKEANPGPHYLHSKHFIYKPSPQPLGLFLTFLSTTEHTTV